MGFVPTFSTRERGAETGERGGLVRGQSAERARRGLSLLRGTVTDTGGGPHPAGPQPVPRGLATVPCGGWLSRCSASASASSSRPSASRFSTRAHRAVVDRGDSLQGLGRAIARRPRGLREACAAISKALAASAGAGSVSPHRSRLASAASTSPVSRRSSPGVMPKRLPSPFSLVSAIMARAASALPVARASMSMIRWEISPCLGARSSASR